MDPSSDRSVFQFQEGLSKSIHFYWYSDDRSIRFNFHRQKSGQNRAFNRHWPSPVFSTNILMEVLCEKIPIYHPHRRLL